jgi:N-carbamoyl-L-amino-acid hydrolase
MLAEQRWPDASLTVGRLDVAPNAQSVVPAFVRLVADARPYGLESPEPHLDAVVEVAGKAARDLDVGVQIDPEYWSFGPVAFDERCLDLLRTAARALGEEPVDLVSPAGHDAGYVARVAPSAMLLVPCRGGVSHHPDEWAEPEHLVAGADVLMHAVANAAGAEP